LGANAEPYRRPVRGQARSYNKNSALRPRAGARLVQFNKPSDVLPAMHEHDDDYDDDSEFSGPSKSQLKREAQALQDLGTELVELRAEQLKRLDLPEDLRDAVELARRINQRGGRKRQLQYIGKLMRGIDAEPIRAALDALRRPAREDTARQHRLENWRDRLLAEGDAALEALLEDYPNADRQHLRRLIRDAQRETTQEKSPKSARALFRYLRDLDGSES